MVRDFEGQVPQIDAKAHVFETAAVIGKVTMKEYSSCWFNVTMRGDVNRIEVGKYSNIQDNSCLHVADKFACIVGDYVTVGHSATLHACTVEDHCLIGMGSTVLDGAVIGHGSIVAAGAVVHHELDLALRPLLCLRAGRQQAEDEGDVPPRDRHAHGSAPLFFIRSVRAAFSPAGCRAAP